MARILVTTPLKLLNNRSSKFESLKKKTKKQPHTKPSSLRLPFCGVTTPEGGFCRKLTGSLDVRE